MRDHTKLMIKFIYTRHKQTIHSMKKNLNKDMEAKH